MENENQNSRPPSSSTPNIANLQKAAATKSNAIEVPQISLPTGGGALRGIDEKFQVNSANGTAGFTIPLPISPGRNGLSPSLGLSYNSGSGNSAFGLGWSLDLPQIQRKTDRQLPQYRGGPVEDIFMLSGSEDLVPWCDEQGGAWTPRRHETTHFIVTAYRPRIEGAFARIERIVRKADGDEFWKVTTRDNRVTFYGQSPEARIADPQNPDRIFSWLPQFSYDDKGNWLRYTYQAENLENVSAVPHEQHRQNGNSPVANRYLKRIQYGNHQPWYADAPYAPTLPDAQAAHFFELVFDYGGHDLDIPTPEAAITWPARPDAFSRYRAGFEVRTYRRCHRILMFHRFAELGPGATLVRALELDYAVPNVEAVGQVEVSYLSQLTQSGYIRRGDGTYSRQTLPSLTFDYQGLAWNTEVRTVAAEMLHQAPVGLSEGYQWTDLYGEGISGILTEQAQGWFYKDNLGDLQGDGQARFAPARQVLEKPNVTGLGTAIRLQDLAANGEKQLVVQQDGLQGYFPLGTEEQVQPFQAFAQVPNVNLQDPNLRMIDLNGDGQAELVLTEENAFVWYASQGKAGYAPARRSLKTFDEEQGPALVFADRDGRESILLADMSGDGLTDIVRVRNGEICYWPNCGYGHFGAKVTMSAAPLLDQPDQFDPALVQLVDISGTGTADLVYLGQNRFRAFFNLSGNAWTSVREIAPFLAQNSATRLSVVDLLGTGTACLVWSSALPGDAAMPMRYIDLMDSTKPHVLVRYANNLGKETRLRYRSSAHDYLRDKQAGQPWITKLPFPVQVVAETTVYEHITGVRFSSSFTYHHGYYDHAEREFRGFGRVETLDSERLTEWQANQAGTQMSAEDAFFQPPTLTKSWFHTGAFIDRENILNQFSQETWDKVYARQFPDDVFTVNEPQLPDARILAAPNLTDPNLLDDFSAEAWQEAFRACKGMVLRQEIFALDGEEMEIESLQRQAKPYRVATHNCLIQVIQPPAEGRHAVFLVAESEALELQYERDESDPRVGHSLNVRFDELGQALESASVVYPRQQVDMNLPEEVRQQQASTFITYTQNHYTNDVITPATYRLRALAQTQGFEITGLSPSGSLFHLTDFADILTSASSPIAYHETASPGQVQRRRIEQVRSYFYQDDLVAALPFGQMESRGISYQNYQLAYTSALLQDIFGNRITDEIALMQEGGFVQIEGDWWIPSGVTQLIDQGTLETLADAQVRFFSPVAMVDPFGAITTPTYYGDYFLMLEAITDSLGNQTMTESFNFRTLSPARVRDPNDNISEVLLDELGLVKAMAVLGKGAEGDNLNGLTEITESAELDQIAQYFDETDTASLRASAALLLGNASVRHVYDFGRYQRSLQKRQEQLDLDPEPTPCSVVPLQPAVQGNIVRELHVQQNPTSPLQLSFVYSDGSGTTTMTKSQAEPGIAQELLIGADCSYTVQTVDTRLTGQLRWLGTGRTILNNKGNPVRQYESYFSVHPGFESAGELVEQGVSPEMYYDALGRGVRTEMPDGTFSLVEFDSWQERFFDASDTVLDSRWYLEHGNPDPEGPAPNQAEALAAWKAAQHHGTPATTHYDPLARPLYTVAHNRANTVDEFIGTRIDLDIEGNPVQIVDARGNAVMQYRYDMLGHQVQEISGEAGNGWGLPNVAGNPLRSWDDRGHLLRPAYDALQRPTHLYLTVQGNPEILVQRTLYGEMHPNAAVFNLRGQTYLQFDGAGRTTSHSFDFKGNLLQSEVRLAHNYQSTPDWSALALLEDPVAVDLAAAPLLESESFVTSAIYDALNRRISSTAPDSSVFLPSYNEANLLEQVAVHLQGAVDATPMINGIDYNVRGQRTRIEFATDDAQNFTTTYEYDPHNFRLLRLRTQRNLDNLVLQDLNYTYDPSGNMTAIRDDAQQTAYFGNSLIQPHSAFTYDALYRLIQAEGREHAVQNNLQRTAGSMTPEIGIPFPNSPEALQRYTQTYVYDAVGNLLQMQHQGGNALRWTRRYQYAANENRLLATSLPGDLEGQFSAPYTYDAHGNMTSMPHLPVMEWNFQDQLQATSRQVVNSGTPETTYYVYSGSGVRVRRVTERQAAQGVTPTRRSERIYVGEFEVYREYDNDGTTISLERVTLHVMDDTRHIAQVDTRTQGNDGVPAQSLRYQIGNHLGSAALEVDSLAGVISYEEYHPYGTSAYRSGRSTAEMSLKRYRYTGKERDEETGLNYHGARYYALWLGRWTAADPIGIGDGVNVYAYVSGNPISISDSNGKEGEDEEARTITVEKPTGPPEDQLVIDIENFREEQQAYHNAEADYRSQLNFYRSVTRFGTYGTAKQQYKNLKHFHRMLEVWKRDLRADAAVLQGRIAEAKKLAPFFQNMRSASTLIQAWAALDLALVAGVALAPELMAAADSTAAWGMVQVWRYEAALGAVARSSPMLQRLAASRTVAFLGATSLAVSEAESVASGDPVRAIQTFRPRNYVFPRKRSVLRGSEQLMLDFGDQRTVFSGHGTWSKADGFIHVQEGTSITVYAKIKKGEAIGERLGQAIELNVDLSADSIYKKTFKPGMLMPNLTLHPPDDLRIMGNPITVSKPTRLGDLLQPNMGACHWAACVERTDTSYFTSNN